MKVYTLLGLALLIAACTAEKESYTHTLAQGEGIPSSVIYYWQEATGIGVTGALDLMESATHIVKTPLKNIDIEVPQVANGNYSISIENEAGTTIFTEIPEKFINMDAEVSFSSKVFEPFFLKEWNPMKGKDYTTLYIKSKLDNQVFYIKVVLTGTTQEIAKYSEDF